MRCKIGSYSDYLENIVNDHIFGKTTFTAGATLYVGLSTTTITDAGGNITEPAGNNYSRVAVTNNVTNFPNSSGGSKTNGTDITFPTATGSWGTVTDFFISDASSGGNIYGYGVLSASKAVGTNDTLKIPTGSLTLSLA